MVVDRFGNERFDTSPDGISHFRVERGAIIWGDLHLVVWWFGLHPELFRGHTNDRWMVTNFGRANFLITGLSPIRGLLISSSI